MRLVVTKLLVRSFDLDHLDLFWEIAPVPCSSPDLDTHEIFDYDFYVLRSGDSPLGEYAQLAGPLRDQYYLRDVQVSLLHKWRKYYYKLKIIHRATGEEFISEPVTFEAERDLIAVEITRQEDMLFREFIGRKCWLFPLRSFGPQCTCYDTVLGRNTRASHLPCFGTGYLGGYHRPIECFVQIDPVGNVRSETPLMEGQPRTTAGRLISFPPVNPGDIIVESENKRWKVISMTPTERLRGVVRQELVIHHIPYGDIEYGLPMNLDASKIEASAKRNFTNPQNLESDGDYADILSFFGRPGSLSR